MRDSLEVVYMWWEMVLRNQERSFRSTVCEGDSAGMGAEGILWNSVGVLGDGACVAGGKA